jgi:hypothetical protein
MLDYYLAGYGLKMMNGMHAGAIKRGWAGDGELISGDGMDANVWAWAGDTTVPVAPDLVTSLHQATTTYRPNRVLMNLIRKRILLPFEAEIARPTYHSKDKNAFQETFYCANGYAMGSVAMTMVDNPTQQTVWSLVCKDKTGSLVFGGGQPRFRHPEGHSPYDQVIQKRGALLLRTGPTQTVTENPTPEQKSRSANAADPLTPLPAPGTTPIAEWWKAAPKAAASWLFVPRRVGRPIERDGLVFLEAGEAFLVVKPMGSTPYWVNVSTQGLPKELDVLKSYRLLVVPAGADGYSGYALEVAERKTYGTLEKFAEAVRLRVKGTAEGPNAAYTAFSGDTLTMAYQPTGLRATGSINGKAIDWAGWANDGVYASPFLTIKDGAMTVSDGKEAYSVRLQDSLPQWSLAQPPPIYTPTSAR